jgi:hypothetical protein
MGSDVEPVELAATGTQLDYVGQASRRHRKCDGGAGQFLRREFSKAILEIVRFSYAVSFDVYSPETPGIWIAECAIRNSLFAICYLPRPHR